MTAARWTALLVLLLSGLVLAFALPVAAQETTGATDTTAVDVGATAAGEDDDSDFSDGEVLVAVAFLSFGAIVLALALWFLSGWRASYQALASLSLERTGALPAVDHNPVELQQTGARGAAPPPKLRIRGPALLHVGRRATFAALQDDAPAEADWEVVSTAGADSGATVDPARGAETSVTVARPGPVTVRAAVGATVAEAHATVVPAPARRGGVPLIGGAYGGITIAITGLTIAGVLTALDKLDGAALAALLGSIVGYFFVGRAGSGNGGAPGSGGDDTAP